jgi:hypothetical protein
VLSVWAFCVAALVFWIGALHLITGLPVVIAVMAVVVLSLAALPCASRMTRIIWDDEWDGGLPVQPPDKTHR